MIKERVTLSSLKSDMWTTEHDATILRFLKDSTLRLLVVYVDKLLGLQVALSVPPHPAEEMTYMIRFEDAVLNPDNIEQKLQFGTIRANHIESLLRTMTNVYAPLFFGNRSWPDSILEKYNKCNPYVAYVMRCKWVCTGSTCKVSELIKSWFTRFFNFCPQRLKTQVK